MPSYRKIEIDPSQLSSQNSLNIIPDEWIRRASETPTPTAFSETPREKHLAAKQTEIIRENELRKKEKEMDLLEAKVIAGLANLRVQEYTKGHSFDRQGLRLHCHARAYQELYPDSSYEDALQATQTNEYLRIL